MATEYVLLEKKGSGWEEASKVKAASPKAAVRHYLGADSKEGGEFVAVPARSWQPVKVQVEQALKFSA